MKWWQRVSGLDIQTMYINKRKLFMKSRYDGNPSKEASIANVRQGRMEAEHNSNNQFVKKVQNEQARHAGRPPKLGGESMMFNAYMCNNGMHAQELARDITRGIDEVAYPVKPSNTSE
jgi:hypothetical protein